MRTATGDTAMPYGSTRLVPVSRRAVGDETEPPSQRPAATNVVHRLPRRCPHTTAGLHPRAHLPLPVPDRASAARRTILRCRAAAGSRVWRGQRRRALALAPPPGVGPSTRLGGGNPPRRSSHRSRRARAGGSTAGPSRWIGASGRSRSGSWRWRSEFIGRASR